MAPTWAVPGLFFLQTTILTLIGPLSLKFLKSYNSYLANLKYWRKSLRSSILTSSKELKGTKGNSLQVFLEFSDRTDVEKSQSVPPFSFFEIVRLFFKKICNEKR